MVFSSLLWVHNPLATLLSVYPLLSAKNVIEKNKKSTIPFKKGGVVFASPPSKIIVSVVSGPGD